MGKPPRSGQPAALETSQEGIQSSKKKPCFATKYRVHPRRNPGFMLDMFIEDPKELRGMTALGVFRVGPKVSGLMLRIIPLETAFPSKYGHKKKLTVHLVVQS